MCVCVCVCVCVCMCLRYTVLFVTACEGWEQLNTEESNNKSRESSKTETEFQSDGYKCRNTAKAHVNGKLAGGDSISREERSLQEPVQRKYKSI